MPLPVSRRSVLRGAVLLGTAGALAPTPLRGTAASAAAPGPPLSTGTTLSAGTAPTTGNASVTGRVALGRIDQPVIANCVTWGARPPSSPVSVVGSRPNKIIVHHTAFPNSTDYSLAQAYANSREIQDLHMDGNGWLDSGQHFTNSRGGHLTEGRHGSLYALLHGQTMVQGAHCVGQNSQAIGIENDGIYVDVQPPQTLWDSLVVFCAFTCQQYGIPASQIYGHKDFASTQCPGLLHDRLPELRTAVAARLG
ncbi:peptidoglycan recognition protein family protein [Micromonospora rifamycinica]|uniref:N-acetylmuramoyl-L-alanine amidase n=1 Tax=Micromonospora rifamycinica TaxID=291594 RepID=A0A109ILD8_9ACTN|nr:peptidoglycan recognition family protein [Micromonospora rifamycinica]KWV32723.1 N-acetylmuramoyl-L-alanine amidase [Micromonospora rifamycinica]SCG44258.1 N-acetylmuramoyl-L-alanine amidase [Micromonospora rifamycinica]